MADAHSKSIDDYRIICERLQRTAFHKYVPGHTLIWGLLWPTQTQKYSPRSGHQGWSLRGWWCMTLFLCGLSIPRDQHYVRPTNIYITFFFLDIFFFLLAERLRGMMNEPTGPVTLRSPSGGLSDEVNFVSTLWLVLFSFSETFPR